MALLPLRALNDRPVTSAAREWLEELAGSLGDASTDRNRLCREILTGLWYPEYASNWDSATAA